MLLDLLKIFIPTALAFILGIVFTPIATHFFYKYKMWKKRVRSEDATNDQFKLVHKEKENAEISVPCVGGIIVWISVSVTIFLFYILSLIFPDFLLKELNFLSRSQTIIPINIFILGALIGLIDDVLEIIGKSNITRRSSLYTLSKVLSIVVLGLIAGSWFFYKLDMHTIHIPFGGSFDLGILFIPFVVIVMLATFSSGVIDGIDGLSGGVLASIFGAYSLIAFTNNQMDLAAFSGVVAGAILAFLWFNIPPARFYMGETGMMPLTVTLATLAFLTDTVLLLPVIAFPLVATSFSSIVQIISKKVFHKKVFLIAPLHHHFEALGWPSYKVTMRYWIISIIFVIIGVILTVIS
jgi:phospho-N-acetylmuramoyl-pentapeptide-transferase